MENKTYNFTKIQNLKHGENTFQSAGLYNYDKEIDWNLIQGIELNYNDILNATTTIEILAEFYDVSAFVAVKFNNPAIVALGADVNNAFEKATDSDPVVLFNSIVGFSKEISPILARKLMEFQINTIIAPTFSEETIRILNKNPNIKVIQINTPLEKIQNFTDEEIKLTPFGALIQEKDKKELDVKSFKVVTKKKPEQKEVEDMIFAHKVVKHARSSASVIAKDLRTLSIVCGQANQIDSVEVALNKVCDSVKDSVVAVDSPIENIGFVQSAAQERVCAIIQPFGTNKDEDIVECADKLNMTMISTGIAHLKG